MERSESNQKKIVIAVLCAVLCVMAVGYAAFSTRLTVDGTASVDSRWSVLFTNATAQATGGATAGTPEIQNTTIDLGDIKLVSPGDTVTYTVTVTNQGTLNARVSGFEWSEDESDAIRYSVTGMQANDVLEAGATDTLTITVTYDPSVQTQPTIRTSDLSVTLNFVQDFGSTVTTKETTTRTTMAPATTTVPTTQG